MCNLSTYMKSCHGNHFSVFWPSSSQKTVITKWRICSRLVQLDTTLCTFLSGVFVYRFVFRFCCCVDSVYCWQSSESFALFTVKQQIVNTNRLLTDFTESDPAYCSRTANKLTEQENFSQSSDDTFSQGAGRGEGHILKKTLLLINLSETTFNMILTHSIFKSIKTDTQENQRQLFTVKQTTEAFLSTLSVSF